MLSKTTVMCNYKCLCCVSGTGPSSCLRRAMTSCWPGSGATAGGTRSRSVSQLFSDERIHQGCESSLIFCGSGSRFKSLVKKYPVPYEMLAIVETNKKNRKVYHLHETNSWPIFCIENGPPPLSSVLEIIFFSFSFYILLKKLWENVEKNKQK